MKEYSLWIILFISSINAHSSSSLNIGRIFGLSNPFAAFHSSSNGRNGGSNGSGPLGNDQGGDPSLAFPFIDFSYSKNYGFKVGRAFASGTNPIAQNKTEEVKTVNTAQNDTVDVVGSNDGQFVNGIQSGIQVNGLNSDSINSPTLINGDESDLDIRNNALGSHSAINANALSGGRQRVQGYTYQRQNGYTSYNQQPNGYTSYNQQPNGYTSYNQQPIGYTSYNQRSNGYTSYNQRPNGNSYNYQQQQQQIGNSNGGQRVRTQNIVNTGGRSNNNNRLRSGTSNIQLQSGNFQTNSRYNYQRNSNIRSRINNNNQPAILLRGDDFDDGGNIPNNNDDNAFDVEDQNVNAVVPIDNNNDDDVGFSNGGSFNNGVDLRGGGGTSINTVTSLKSNDNNSNDNTSNNSNANTSNNSNGNTNNNNNGNSNFPQKFQFLLTPSNGGNNNNNNNNNDNNNSNGNNNLNFNNKNFFDFPQKFQFLLTAFQGGNNDNSNNNNNNNPSNGNTNASNGNSNASNGNNGAANGNNNANTSNGNTNNNVIPAIGNTNNNVVPAIATLSSQSGNNKKRSFSENGLSRNLQSQPSQQSQLYRSREIPLFDNIGPQENSQLQQLRNNNFNQGLTQRTRYVPVPSNFLNKNEAYKYYNSKSEKKLITSNRDVVIRCPTGTNCVIYALSKSGFL